MDATQFAALVGRLERVSDRHPRAYVLRLLLVVSLGYAPLALALLCLLVALGSMASAFLSDASPGLGPIVAVFLSAFAAIVIAKAMISTALPIAGREITSDECPALFNAVDEVLQKLAASAEGTGDRAYIHTITIDREFALRLHLIPQWGVLGKVTHELRIGLPLLQAISIAELKALLAHELAHLGSPQTRLSSWIYRQRVAWEAIEERFAEPSSISDKVLAPVFGRYATFFLAYSLIMARNHEYAADRAAAQATHPRLLARALIKTELIGRFLAEVFWTRLFEQVERLPEPQYLPYSVLSRAIHLAHKQWQRSDWMHQAIRQYPAEHETHPALGERLAALDVPAELPSTVAESAALTLLGEAAAPIVREFDEAWKAEYVPAWRKRHDAIREARWKIAQYESVAEAEMKPEDLWKKATLLLDIALEREAIDALTVLVSREPKMAQAQFLLGRMLLERADERGLKHLALAAHHDTELLDAVGELGYGYLVQRGRRAEAQRFWDRVQAA